MNRNLQIELGCEYAQYRITGANPEMTMLVYRETSYPAREVQGKDGNYLVSVERLEQELMDGIRSLDPAAFDLDEEIAYYCSDEEIRLLTDDELEQMIYG